MNMQTLNISLPKDLVKEVDKLAKEDYSNRSEFIRASIKAYLRQRARWKEILAYGKAQGKKMGIKSEKQVNDIVYEFRHGRKPD